MEAASIKFLFFDIGGILLTNGWGHESREEAAKKVERTMRKVAAAVLLSKHIGETYEGIVTGVTDSGTFARLIKPPAEGRIINSSMRVGRPINSAPIIPYLYTSDQIQAPRPPTFAGQLPREV